MKFFWGGHPRPLKGGGLSENEGEVKKGRAARSGGAVAAALVFGTRSEKRGCLLCGV